MLALNYGCKHGLHQHCRTGTPLNVGLTPSRRRMAAMPPKALFGRKTAKKEERKEEKDWRGSVLNALDFAETRSQEDAKLLGTARNKKKGDRLTDDEARALRRKVGGTASNYFKEWVDVKGAYADKGYVSKAELPPALPFLLVVVLGLAGAVGYVVTQTNAPATTSASSTELTRTLTREQREEYGLR